MDTDYLKQHYSRLETEELLRLKATDLTPIAKVILDSELSTRTDIETALTASNLVSSSTPLDEMLLAPLWKRFVAGTIDFGGIWLALIAVNFPLYLYTPKSFSDFISYVSFLVAFVYMFFKDGMTGQSVGKKLLKIRVLERATGAPCGLPRSFIRNLFVGFGVIDWAFALGRESRRLGDQVAGTYVVNA